MSKYRFVLLLILVLLMAVGCEANSAPPPESDSSQSYQSGAQVPVDNGVYTIEIQIVNEIESLTRQTQAAYGSAFMYGGYGSASYFGPEYGGKGFVRGLVLHSDSDLARVGHVVVLKSTDTKATMLRVGDVTVFKCRKQYEAVAAVLNYETFDAEKLATWELDYCRLASPDLGTIIEPTAEP